MDEYTVGALSDAHLWVGWVRWLWPLASVAEIQRCVAYGFLLGSCYVVSCDS